MTTQLQRTYTGTQGNVQELDTQQDHKNIIKQPCPKLTTSDAQLHQAQDMLINITVMFSRCINPKLYDNSNIIASRC